MAKPANSRVVQYFLLRRAVRAQYFLLVLVIMLNGCAMEGDNLTKVSDIQGFESKPIIVQESKKKPSSEKGKNKPEELPPESTEIEREVFQKDRNGQAVPPEIDFANFRKRLLGLDADEVMGLLGLPVFRRNEPPAEIWQYRTLACVVDVFLYKSAENLGVNYVETRGRDKQVVDEITCFGSLLKKFSPSSRRVKTS